MNRLGVALIVLIFLALRIALLLVREPFFDELFTAWISGKSFAGIVQALMNDSGPPLYYFVVHALGLHSVFAARVLSLVFSSVSLALLIADKRYAVAALLAVFPPAVLFAVDARAYAMCAMFVTIGVLALDREKHGTAALAFVLAAYSHYYGVLFFPLLLRRPRAFIAAFVAFAPGFWLAFHQPAAATAWIGRWPSWPDALFARPPLALALFGLVLTAIQVAGGRWQVAGEGRARDPRPATRDLVNDPRPATRDLVNDPRPATRDLVNGRRPATRDLVNVAVPIACALLLMLVGRPVYLPMRFESVIASPLMLAITMKPRRIVIGSLALVFLVITYLGILDQAQRPLDDYRAAALWSKRLSGPLVASGYLYLETIVNARLDAIAFPPEQAVHPGWRTLPRPGSAPPDVGSALPRGPFYWIGERLAPELSILRRTHRIEPLYVNDRAVVALVR
jgi:hypothetical protein